LPLLRTEIDSKNDKPVGVGMRLGGDHGGDFELNFAKILDGNHEVPYSRDALMQN
jgi:hypothetical protein